MILLREEYLKKVRPHYEVNLIKVLSGVRRSGKSELLKQIKQDLIDNNKISEDHIIFIDFENITFGSFKHYLELYNYIRVIVRDEKKYYLFIDEIQHLEDFELLLASLNSNFNISIFVTGSNSKLLSGELRTKLVGRTIEFVVYPFSYKEMLEYCRLVGLNIEDEFNNYLIYGGLPLRFKYTEENDILMYLEQTFGSILEHDIKSRDSNMEREKFVKVSGYILKNAGRDFSGNNIANFYNYRNENNKQKLSNSTVYSYIERMERAFLIRRVPRFNIKGKEILSFLEKNYVIDNGLRISKNNGESIDKGLFFENLIFLELIRRDYKVYVGKIYNNEIDFVVQYAGQTAYIQAAYTLFREDGSLNQETVLRKYAPFHSVVDYKAKKYVITTDNSFEYNPLASHLNVIYFLIRDNSIFSK